MCPIRSTHDKYNEAQYFFGMLLNHYHDPYEFQFNLNAFIQAIRNITFMMQAEVNKPEGFFSWYDRKRELMKADPKLLKFVEARNVLVKRSSLELESKFRSGVFRGRQLKLVIEYDLPPFTDSREALERANEVTFDLFLDAEHSAIGEQAGVERTWIAAELGSDEVAELCLHALNVMGALVAELHRLYGKEDQHEHISVDLDSFRVLLETDLDPTLFDKWGW